MTRRFAHAHGKPDGATKAIVDALRFAGAYVVLLGGVGQGCPDLMVGMGVKGVTEKVYLLEVKNPKKRATPKLRESQEVFRKLWRGCAVHVVTTPEEALRAVGVRVRR